jgi:hypothetical protein
VGNSRLKDRDYNAIGFNENLSEISLGYEFKKNNYFDKLTVQIGYKNRMQETGSGGQNVAVAYSFATSILERSGIQFPLLVDHPFTALQESARREMAEILDKICHQFVGFVIDTEKQGFLPQLMRSSSTVNLITIFNDIEGNQPHINNLPNVNSKVYRSNNGIVCYDKDFFEDFRDLNSSEEI